ncbi:MAG: Choline dehydrogenase-like flavoprotein [Myxococcaceae bacterium]|nr:Choline dehydrogenase-like flavoprotein [Myxococcaceae bacterium]
MSNDIVGNQAITKFDVLVIGSGAGGSPVAYLLAAAGQKVLVLEAGANRFDKLDAPDGPISRSSNDELKLLRRNFLNPDPIVEPRTWRTSEADGDRKGIGEVNSLAKTVGGGATHADLKMPRFYPDDFKLKTLLGDVANANFADWPVQYDELEPYYLFGERALGVQGVAGANPFEGPRSGDFPMGFGNDMYCSIKVKDGAAKLGYTVAPYAAALNSKPYDGRPACVDCGFCSGYGCPTNARGTPAVTMLRKALMTGNCLLRAETRVVKLLTNGAKTEITGVECIGPDGKRVTYTADRYVLAASPIEDARLLFLSDPAGLGNSSNMVGRHLMFHLHTDAVAVFDERLHSHRGRTVTHFLADFRGKPNDAARPLGGIVEISASGGLLLESGFYKRALTTLGKWDGGKFLRLMDQSPFRDRAMALAMVGEDAPQLTNRVDLDPAVKDLDGLPVARVTYNNHAYELSAREFYAPKMLEVLKAAGARFVGRAPVDDIPATSHIMGTLRSGTDPKTSVCDPNGRFHDIGNLYASDGALFPTSAGANPTMTIVALALRVGAAMVNATSPLSALPPPPAG